MWIGLFRFDHLFEKMLLNVFGDTCGVRTADTLFYAYLLALTRGDGKTWMANAASWWTIFPKAVSLLLSLVLTSLTAFRDVVPFPWPFFGLVFFLQVYLDESIRLFVVLEGVSQTKCPKAKEKRLSRVCSRWRSWPCRENVSSTYVGHFGNSYSPITYCTVPLILDHSYLVGKSTSSKIADTKVHDFRGSKAFVSAIFELVKFRTRYEWSSIRGTVQ